MLRGILLMCAGVSLFPFMNAAVKLLAQDYPIAEIVWARFTGHLIGVTHVLLGSARLGSARLGRQGANRSAPLPSTVIDTIRVQTVAPRHPDRPPHLHHSE